MSQEDFEIPTVVDLTGVSDDDDDENRLTFEMSGIGGNPDQSLVSNVTRTVLELHCLSVSWKETWGESLAGDL